MKVLNIHSRKLVAPTIRAGALIDSLATAHDRLWPRDAWPAMKLDRPLGVGADGGHGPIRYTVVAYVPGRSITFQFKAPRGVDGVHGFEVVPDGEGSKLRHVLDVALRFPATLTWPLVIRRLHDALLEDALATAQVSLGEPPTIVPWSRAVRVLRWLAAPGRARPQMQPTTRPTTGPAARHDRRRSPLRARARRDRARGHVARMCQATRRRLARTKPQ